MCCIQLWLDARLVFEILPFLKCNVITKSWSGDWFTLPASIQVPQFQGNLILTLVWHWHVFIYCFIPCEPEWDAGFLFSKYFYYVWFFVPYWLLYFLYSWINLLVMEFIFMSVRCLHGQDTFLWATVLCLCRSMNL